MIVKLLMKTKPMSQWNVKREALRRIKIRFDELGIDIPLPQREVHVAGDGRLSENRGEHADESRDGVEARSAADNGRASSRRS